MKLGSTIKKCIGLLYVSALGFSVVGINKSVQVKAVDEYDAGLPFTGSWSLESNSGTGLTELCFTRDSDSEEFFFEPQSATYFSLCETADIICSAYYYDENNQNALETLSDTTVTIHLNSVSTPTLNAANATYTITGVFPNDSVSGVSYTVSRNIYTEDSSNLDPHLSSTPDGGWVDEGGSLVYRIDEQTTADYYANYIEYHTETIGQQQTRNEAIFFMRVYEGNETLLENAAVQISNPTLSPSPNAGQTSFTGTISGQCDATSTQLTLSATQVDFVYITDGWSYDTYHLDLIYNSAEYTEPECHIDTVYINSDSEIEIQYLSEKYGMTFNAVLSNASYSDASGIVTGDLALNGSQTQTTIEVSTGSANLIDLRSPNYSYGWNYDEGDNYIFWYDEDYPDSSYEMDSAIYKIESQQIVVTVKDSEEYDEDEHTGVVDVIEYDSQENSVHGYMDIDSSRTEVTFTLGDLVPEEVEKWNFSDGQFSWVTEQGDEISQSSLTTVSATFYSHEINHSDDYFELVFSYQQNELPKLTLSGATYEEAGQTAQGYTVSGFCSYVSINDNVTFNIDSFDTVDVPVIDGWYYVSETFVYYYNNQRITPTLVSCDFYQYGNSDNYCEIVYSAQIPGGSALEETVTITDAGCRTPQETQTEFYSVTGFYEGKEISLKVESLENHAINHYEYDGGFVYVLPDEALELGCEVTYLVFNNYGNGSNINEAYVTFQAFNEYGGNTEYIDDSIETLYIEQCVLTLDPRYTQDQVGTISGHWKGQEVDISFNNSVFVINDLQEGEEGLHYLEGLNIFVYFDNQGTLYKDVSIESVTLDTYTYEATVSYSVTDLQLQDEFVLQNVSYEDLSDQGAYVRYFIKGYNEDLFDDGDEETEDRITFYSPLLYTEDSRGPYWSYSDGYLLYIDSEHPEIETQMVACIYFMDEEYFELSYYLINERDGGYDTATIILSNAELGRDYNPNAEEPAERSGYISGNCSVLDSQDNYITLIVDIEIQKRGNEPYWSYGDDYLEYIDPSNENLETTMVSCTYYEESAKFEIEYSIGDTVTETFTIETIVLTNGVIVRDYDPSGEEPALRSGYISGNCSEIEISDPITLIVDVEITRIPATLPDPTWVYNDDELALWWNDPAHEEYQTELEEAYYYDRTHSVTFMYSIVTYTVAEQGSDAPVTEPTGQGAVRTIVLQKTAHMNEITFEDDEEMFVYVTGTCTECEDATTIVVPRDKFITATYDDDPGTITPDQQVDIKELLPEEKTVTEERMEESIVAISSETAHEIIVTVSDAHEQNEAALASGEITQEKYEENKQIIETVTEASVVVGAGATTASDEGKAVDNALPEDHELGFTMDETLSEFYQLQMDYLLGRRKAPGEDDSTKGILRAGSNTNASSINLNVSAADYAKMIDFVDTAVSNMKDAALQIRKCSTSKMKKVVGDYIQVVKVSSFREFDATAAENEFVDAVYKAIMLNMQQQVVEALKRDHKPTNNPEKELLYRQQLEACEDFDTFEELVLEVLRQKYNSISNAQEVSIDEFRDTYRLIFRSWALNKPEENPTSITLEQLTTATIETTKANANRFEYRSSFDNKESLVFIIFGAVAVLGIASAVAVPILTSKSKQKRA